MSMNKEKLKELAATLNGIAEGKAWEIQWVLDGWGPPLEVGVQEALKAGYNIRLKPPTQQHDPYAELKAAHAAGKAIQCDCGGIWRDWNDPHWSLPPERYRIKPETRRVPLCANDIKSGDEFLHSSGLRYTWHCIYTNAVQLSRASTFSFEQLMEEGWKIRSIGETEWRECSKEEEVEA